MSQKINYNTSSKTELDFSKKWKLLPSNNRYLVSEDGQVYDIEQDCFKTQYNNRAGFKSSYKFVSLKMERDQKCKTKYVHRLVAECFIGICPEGYQVDHIDGDPTNNHYNNLQYLTPKENVQKSKGRKYRVALEDKDIVACRLAYKKGVSIGELAKKTGYSYTGMHKICKYLSHNNKNILDLEQKSETIEIYNIVVD